MARKTPAQREMAKRKAMVATDPQYDQGDTGATQTISSNPANGGKTGVRAITGESHEFNLLDQIGLRRGWPMSDDERKRILDNQVKIAADPTIPPQDSTRAFKILLEAERDETNRLLAVLAEHRKVTKPEAPDVHIHLANKAEAALFGSVDHSTFAQAAQQQLAEQSPQETGPMIPALAPEAQVETRPGYKPK